MTDEQKPTVVVRDFGLITWAQLRQKVDEYLQEQGLPADIQIEYIDFSWSSSEEVGVGANKDNGLLVIR